MEQIEHKLDRLFGKPVIRGTRITRFEEKDVGPFHLTPDVADRLGTNNVGLFIGNCQSYERAVTLVERLGNNSNEGKWIVVLSSKAAAESTYRRITDDHTTTRPPSVWDVGQILYCVPESLKQLRNVVNPSQIAGIVVLDINCQIHKARGFYSNNFRVAHDRPQMIVDYRASLTEDGWTPPLVFLAKKPAKSINTEPIVRTYCMEAMKYLDGQTVRMGDPPASFAPTSSPSADRVLQVT